jgi:Serpin (serine protease inhibitor)
MSQRARDLVFPAAAGCFANAGQNTIISPSSSPSSVAMTLHILPYVNVAEHKTYVQVDESGTVAAAATGVGETSVVSLSVNLQANHPFFYAIRDNQTGELLFVGVLMNPSAG